MPHLCPKCIDPISTACLKSIGKSPFRRAVTLRRPDMLWHRSFHHKHINNSLKAFSQPLKMKMMTCFDCGGVGHVASVHPLNQTMCFRCKYLRHPVKLSRSSKI